MREYIRACGHREQLGIACHGRRGLVGQWRHHGTHGSSWMGLGRWVARESRDQRDKSQNGKNAKFHFEAKIKTEGGGKDKDRRDRPDGLLWGGEMNKISLSSKPDGIGAGY